MNSTQHLLTRTLRQPALLQRLRNSSTRNARHLSSRPSQARPKIPTLFRPTKPHTSPRSPPRRPYSTSPPPQQPPTPNPTPNLTSPPPSLSLSQRLRKLSREYGWSALGVYLALSALDFPFCFLAVRWLGTDRIGAWEHAIIDFVKGSIPFEWPGKTRRALEGGADGEEGEAVVESHAVGEGWGVEEARVANNSAGASIWTQLALAYAIHKSFIFLRVPVTAAVTPKVVKTLRGWGWDIGKRVKKA